MKLEISFSSVFKVNDKDVFCNINISSGKLYLLTGRNGIGKTSLIHYLKKNAKLIFQNKTCAFTDQVRLSPLNDISFDQTLEVLSGNRNEKNILFTDFRNIADDFKNLPIKLLSGGQNQIVKILISLYISGDIFIFDEPFQFLDSKNKNNFKMILSKLKAQNKSILIVEHQVHFIKELINEYIDFIDSDKVLIENRNGI